VTKASARVLLRVELQGVDPPGRSCGPRPGGGWYREARLAALCPRSSAGDRVVDRGRLISSGRDSGTFASAQRRL
jgi:hypothetical protein